ncbi:flagellar basal-body MS-ring/collar protein FliF [Paenarthrobacter ureafaciens]
MPPAISQFFRKLGTGMQAFSPAQRTLAILGVAVIVLGGVALTAWLGKPAYSPLFSGLKDTDANSIVEQLRKDNIPYELSNGGSTILVPEDKVYDERLKAAAAGLPTAAATGYSLLDKLGVTSSEFQQSVTYKRALEGELSTTIQAMDGVKSAAVQLAIPEKSVFVATTPEATASVFVETQPGTTLSSDKVQAIVHLTSASIENLKPTNVSVVDSQGNVLSTVGGGATGSSSKQASDYQQRTSDAVRTVLDSVVGPGNSTVAVAADVTAESAQQRSETFSPATNTPALSESTKTEKYTGTGGGAAGVLGPDNIAVPGGTSANGSYDSSDTTKNNAVNKVTEDRTIPQGAVKRQTISVAINQSAAGGVNIDSVRSLVTAAAGINTARGDVVTVEVLPFSTAAADKAAEALGSAQGRCRGSQRSSAHEHTDHGRQHLARRNRPDRDRLDYPQAPPAPGTGGPRRTRGVRRFARSHPNPCHSRSAHHGHRTDIHPARCTVGAHPRPAVARLGCPRRRTQTCADRSDGCR